MKNQGVSQIALNEPGFAKSLLRPGMEPGNVDQHGKEEEPRGRRRQRRGGERNVQSLSPMAAYEISQHQHAKGADGYRADCADPP